MPDSRNPRTSIGVALLVSSFVILVMAVLFGAGVLPVDSDVRTPIVAALGLVALLDVVIGLWFLKRGK